MSSQGVALIMRAGLVLLLAIAAAVFRALIGPGRKRDQLMLAGTLGGISMGVLAGYLISPSLHFDVSAISASVGMVLGWATVWLVAHRRPRETN